MVEMMEKQNDTASVVSGQDLSCSNEEFVSVSEEDSERHSHLQQVEAQAIVACSGELQIIRKMHPEWFARYEDNPLEYASSEDLLGLLADAPTSFAKGMLFGSLMMRLEIASVTGRSF